MAVYNILNSNGTATIQVLTNRNRDNRTYGEIHCRWNNGFILDANLPADTDYGFVVAVPLNFKHIIIKNMKYQRAYWVNYSSKVGGSPAQYLMMDYPVQFPIEQLYFGISTDNSATTLGGVSTMANIRNEFFSKMSRAWRVHETTGVGFLVSDFRWGDKVELFTMDSWFNLAFSFQVPMATIDITNNLPLLYLRYGVNSANFDYIGERIYHTIIFTFEAE